MTSEPKHEKDCRNQRQNTEHRTECREHETIAKRKTEEYGIVGMGDRVKLHSQSIPTQLSRHPSPLVKNMLMFY